MMTASELAGGQSQESVNLIQISDCHLFEYPDSCLLGMNCNDSLDAVLDLIRNKAGSPDYFLCTGDLVQDGSATGYRALRDKLAAFATPSYWLCGNHDNAEAMNAVLDESSEHYANHCDELVFGNWHLVFLNTQVEGKIYGNLNKAQLEMLHTALVESSDEGRFVLISMHHNPVDVPAAWLQRHSLREPAEFFDVLDGFDHIRGIVHGHIHQEREIRKNGIPVWSVPSTCVQFHPDSDVFTLDTLHPGYRWLRLFDDGKIETGVKRLKEFEFDVDFDSGGY